MGTSAQRGRPASVECGLLCLLGAARFERVAVRWSRPNYRATTTTSNKTEEIHITFANGNVKLFTIVPDPPVNPNRTPVTDAHRRGVLDPLTAWLVHVPGTGDVLTPDACHRSTAVFNGYARYDLNLVFKRMETVTAEKGYRGPVMVCAWHVVPVAGYTPEDIKHSAAQRNNEIAFAPVTGTRVLVPFWIKWSTPLGPFEIEATSFITEPQPPQNPRTFRPALTKPAKPPPTAGQTPAVRQLRE
jgi:hypothetical protein